MTYIIAEPCIGVKDTACVDVCPVDCIHPTKNETEEFEKENKLYIDPEECIDCGACERSALSRPSLKRRRLRRSGRTLFR
jgi:ferredoxin